MKRFVSWVISSLYRHPIMEALIPTQIRCLKKALADCESVLDLGCGPSSPIRFCGPFKRSVGVEPFLPYLSRARALKSHHELIGSKIEDLDFPEKSFDAVVLLEVLEHMPEDLGRRVLEKAGRWARRKVVVTTPNGFIPQKSLDGNPLQEHLSGWNVESLGRLGFACRGLAGLKFLRQEVQGETMGDDFTVSIKFRPRFFWFAVSALSQVFTHRFPRVSFELFAVKKVF